MFTVLKFGFTPGKIICLTCTDLMNPDLIQIDIFFNLNKLFFWVHEDSKIVNRRRLHLTKHVLKLYKFSRSVLLAIHCKI